MLPLYIIYRCYGCIIYVSPVSKGYGMRHIYEFLFLAVCEIVRQYVSTMKASSTLIVLNIISAWLVESQVNIYYINANYYTVLGVSFQTVAWTMTEVKNMIWRMRDILIRDHRINSMPSATAYIYALCRGER